MPETTTVIGTLKEIAEKPTGWTSVHVNLPGKEYPLKMDTKIQALIEAARAAGTNVMAWSYSESDSGTPNPNRPGTNYVNRRLEKVAVINADDANAHAAESSPPPAQAAPTATTSTPRNETERASIERQTIVKAAIDLYPTGLVKSDADFFFLLAKLERFCAHGSYSALSGEDPDNIPF